MKVKPVLQYPNPILSKKSTEIVKIDRNLRKLVDSMFETMYRYQGIGLAAPQIGQNLRLFVIDLGENEETFTQPEAYLNPKILTRSEELIDSSEGCLSIADFRGEVKRARSVVLQYTNLAGKTLQTNCEGLLSRCVQHELDHLDGILFIDRLADKSEFENQRANLNLK